MHISLPLVKANNVFGQCSSGFTASLSVLMREIAFTGDETIFHTNDVSTELYIIAKNTVKIMVTKDGQQQVSEECICNVLANIRTSHLNQCLRLTAM
jgi:hypothetical protein